MTLVKTGTAKGTRSVPCSYGWGSQGKYVLDQDPIEAINEELPWIIGPFVREVTASEINLKRHLSPALQEAAKSEAGYEYRGLIGLSQRSAIPDSAILPPREEDYPFFKPKQESPLMDRFALSQFINLHINPDGICASLAEKYGTLADHGQESGTIYESVRAWKCESFLAWAALLILECETFKQWEETTRPLLLRQYKRFCKEVPLIDPSQLSKIPAKFQSHFLACFDESKPSLNNCLYLHIPEFEHWWAYLIGTEQFDNAEIVAVRLIESRIKQNCRAGLLFNGKPIVDPRLHLPERPEGSNVDTLSPSLIASNLCGAMWLRVAQRLSKEPSLAKFCLDCGCSFEPNPRQCKFCKKCRKGIGRASNAASARQYRRRIKEKKERDASSADSLERLKMLAEQRKQENIRTSSSRKNPSRILLAKD